MGLILLPLAVLLWPGLGALPGALVRAQDEGQPCSHTRLGVAGTCKFLKDCAPAVADLKDRRINPQICGFRPSSLVPNVCCPLQGVQGQGVQGGTDITQRDQVGIIAKRKCQEYATTARQEGYCRRNSSVTVQKLIVNGVPAKPKEFPHMALLGYGPADAIEYSCAGSLISDRWVLTAAHCLSHPSMGAVTQVLLGDLDRSSDEDDARPQVVAVDRPVRHPDFEPKLRYHDIALLRLARPVTLSEYVRPACIHTDRVDVGTNVTVSGWGVTDFAEDALSSVLLKAQLNVVAAASCNQTFAAAANTPGSKLPQGIKDTQLCAGSTLGKDACQGDSGGPLQVFTPDSPYCMQHVVGVVSLGIFCGSKAPGVYSKVSAYIPWIERTVWPAGTSNRGTGPMGAGPAQSWE